MVIYLIEMFAVSLAITVVVELVVVYFLLRIPISHMVWKLHVNAGNRNRGVEPHVDAGSSHRGAELHVDAGSNYRKVEPCVDAGSCYRGVNLATDVKGTRGKWKVTWWLLVVLVNVLTNPPAVLFCWLGRMYLPPDMHFPVQIAVEMAVIAVEAWVYRSFSEKSEWEIKNPVLLSIAANGCSWITGIFLMVLRS